MSAYGRRRYLTRRAGTVVIVLVGLLPACSSDEAGSEIAEWSRLGETAYVLPEDLPEGWALSSATERRGRPFDEWEDHAEIFSTEDRDRFLIVTASLGGGDGSGAPGEVEPVDPEDLTYLLIYTVGTFPEGATAARTSWQENGFRLSVTEVGPAPDPQLIQEVAENLRGIDGLDFDVPTPPAASGYAPVARSAAFPVDVTDYTIVWRPEQLAGRDRSEATSLSDEGPQLFVNVGCRFYAQAQIADGSPTDLTDVAITREGDLLQLDYLLDGSSIRVSGSEISEDELRTFARSLHAHDRNEWVERLGSRLLVNESEA